MKLSDNTQSVLTRLPAPSVLKLFFIAGRPIRDGISPDNKQAIRRIFEIQLFKAVVIGCFIVISAFAYRDRSFGAIAALLVHRLYFLPALLIMPVIDWFLWDTDLEASLRREIKVREVELGLSEVELRISQASEVPMDMEFVKPLSDTEIKAGLEKINRDAAAAGMDSSEFVRKDWEARAGIVETSDSENSQQYASLKSYLES